MIHIPFENTSTITTILSLAIQELRYFFSPSSSLCQQHFTVANTKGKIDSGNQAYNNIWFWFFYPLVP